MSQSPEISIIAPCHNEEENLVPLTTAIRNAVEATGRSYEIILVDDGSTDRTWEILEQLGERNPALRALRFAVNRGQSAALWAGM